MTRIDLTNEWSIDLGPGFQRRAEDGDLVFWRPGRTVYVAVYAAGSAEAEEAMAKMLEDRSDVPKKTFDRSEPGLVGHACLLPEGEDDNAYWGLNTWADANGSVACVTFYFDNLDDLGWALEAWQSLRRGEGEARAYLN